MSIYNNSKVFLLRFLISQFLESKTQNHFTIKNLSILIRLNKSEFNKVS